MPKSGVPLPGNLRASGGEADGPIDVEVQDVEPTRRPLHLRQQSPQLVLDPQHSMLDEDLVVIFIELPQTDNVCCQLGNVVHAGEHLVVTVLALEEDGPAALNGHDRAVSETDGSLHAGVDVGEGTTLPRHVICCPGVEDPPRGPASALVAELDEQLVLLQVDALLVSW